MMLGIWAEKPLAEPPDYTDDLLMPGMFEIFTPPEQPHQPLNQINKSVLV